MSDKRQHSILIVDDDKAMRQSLIELMEAAGWRVEAVSRANRVAGVLSDFTPDVILSDVRMPGMSGLELLASLDLPLSPPLVLISAHGDIPMAVQAIQDGAYSFVEKPCEPRRLLTILRNAAQQYRMKQSNNRLKKRLMRLSGLDRVLIGQNREIEAQRQDILELADIQTSVLVQGETGTGKEVVARALHDLGPNADGPFLAINCAMLSPDTFETEMFGISEGKDGRLLAAAGGTLFLDEICSCPMPVQAQLLRVIENKRILPVGSTAPIPVDFRVVSASNEDVNDAVADKRLRQDLLFRINTFVLSVPALRHRRDDIMLLMTHFLDEFARIYDCALPELQPDDIAMLMAHDWPGNVRELRSVAERRVLAERRGKRSMSDVINAELTLDDGPNSLRDAVAALERELISKAIQVHEGRMDSAAEALGIGRRTLNEKIVKLGLDKDSLL
ncbi:two-component system, NtrC family, C4-dicarboxylate transport response regulator DctD [Cohaesibacter sp. ES.047]|uniref:sigma-54-dependent transcriptional regulator n=1 Tax=Cohaesibacter sp. ES.047 TaxID=1798205 RepID=UPI000BB7938B|nr:sigma-54 dependent transcriptional regulator [Cohaesibacter sp. ES.047]SNY93189.1 two-component system, NtrC family, C4-dicarboxylate transport response regulator DctD [Cohaesibacter sp. ES.047]